MGGQELCFPSITYCQRVTATHRHLGNCFSPRRVTLVLRTTERCQTNTTLPRFPSLATTDTQHSFLSSFAFSTSQHHPQQLRLCLSRIRSCLHSVQSCDYFLQRVRSAVILLCFDTPASHRPTSPLLYHPAWSVESQNSFWFHTALCCRWAQPTLLFFF